MINFIHNVPGTPNKPDIKYNYVTNDDLAIVDDD